nr:ATP-binding cassette domain-containing protein [Methanosphaera stadtmanae]
MEYIIQTQNLTKKYKNDTVVNNLNLKIKEGEIYGLLGQNGAGKTTTMCLLTNLSEKTSGQIRIFGKNPQENIDIYKKNRSYNRNTWIL